MKLKFRRSGIALVVLGSLRFMQPAAGAYRELVPAPRAYVDDEQEMAFYLGPVVFQIKNKNLVLPFPRSDHPFDASVCGERELRDFERKLCVDGPKSVFIQIPLSTEGGHDQKSSFISIVTLGYKQNYNFHKGSADDFVSETNAYDGGHVREPDLDTKNYAAVRILPKKEFESLPNWRQIGGTTYFFIAKGDQTPHVISCRTALDQKAVPADAFCQASAWFLTQEYPGQKDGKYTFSLEYQLQAAEIDQAPKIEQAVLKAVLEFPRSRIKWPVDLR